MIKVRLEDQDRDRFVPKSIRSDRLKKQEGDAGTVVTADDVSTPTYGRSKTRKRELWVE